MRRLGLIIALAAVVFAPASATATPSWLLRVGSGYVKVGEYRIGLTNTRLLDAIKAFGEPSLCRVIGQPNHVQATWSQRGLFGDFWTFGGLPSGEDGCWVPVGTQGE